MMAIVYNAVVVFN